MIDRLAWLMRYVQYIFLREAIRSHGVISPIIVTRDGTVLDGSRRVRACIELGIAHVPAVIVSAEIDNVDPRTLTGLCPVEMPNAAREWLERKENAND